MPTRNPSLALLLVTGLSLFACTLLPCLGWGGASGLFCDPARAGAFLVVGLASLASLFTGINLGGCVRADAKNCWLMAPLALISLEIAGGPAYDDRPDVHTIDGNATRHVGLVLLVVGAVLRVGPMFVLGRRFTWPLASQAPHALVTAGFYRLIRHPSYVGAFLGGIGWVLVFRSGLGLILMALLIPAFLPVVGAEEERLAAEFGDQYEGCRKKTWRLVPYLY